MDISGSRTASVSTMTALACHSLLRYLRLLLVCTAPSAAQKKNRGEDSRPIHLSHRGILGIYAPMWSAVISMRAIIFKAVPLICHLLSEIYVVYDAIFSPESYVTSVPSRRIYPSVSSRVNLTVQAFVSKSASA